MAGYEFLSTWRLDAPVERVWDVLSNDLVMRQGGYGLAERQGVNLVAHD